MIESGQLTAMAYLPWTFKLFWGPLIDSFTYRAMGRRRPWLLASIFPLGLAFYLIWNPPPALSTGELTAWMAFGVFLFYTAMTIVVVPHQSLGAEISERSGAKFAVSLNGHTANFHHASHSLPKDEVRQLRSFLETAGVNPERDYPL